MGVNGPGDVGQHTGNVALAWQLFPGSAAADNKPEFLSAGREKKIETRRLQESIGGGGGRSNLRILNSRE